MAISGLQGLSLLTTSVDIVPPLMRDDPASLPVPFLEGGEIFRLPDGIEERAQVAFSQFLCLSQMTLQTVEDLAREMYRDLLSRRSLIWINTQRLQDLLLGFLPQEEKEGALTQGKVEKALMALITSWKQTYTISEKEAIGLLSWIFPSSLLTAYVFKKEFQIQHVQVDATGTTAACRLCLHREDQMSLQVSVSQEFSLSLPQGETSSLGAHTAYLVYDSARGVLALGVANPGSKITDKLDLFQEPWEVINP